MRAITIVGAGQAGLQLGLALLQRGYEVTIVSDRTPDEILYGWSTGSAGLFSRALALESSLGCSEPWQEAPYINAVIGEFFSPEGEKLLLNTLFEKPGRAIDQRLKHSHWLRVFEARGGRVVIHAATIADLEQYAQASDLLVVATGARGLCTLFERDAARSPYEQPQRHLMQFNLYGVEPLTLDGHPAAKMEGLAGQGEIFYLPFFSHEARPAFNLLVEAVPGSPLDRFQTGQSGEELLAIYKEMAKELTPWMAEHTQHAELTDERGWLRGAITPTVRKPVAALPSGALAMAIGDVSVLNDPICAQGANTGTKYAHFLADRIAARGEEPFDRAWIEEGFESFWDYAQHGVLFNNTMLQPPAPHLQRIFWTASQNPRVAADFFGGMDHPPSVFPWFTDPAAADEYLAAHGVPAAMS